MQIKDVGVKSLHGVAVQLDASQKPQRESVCAAHTSAWEVPGSTHHWQTPGFNENYCADRSLAASITWER